MTSLLSTILGDVTYDDKTNAYYWHPWMDDDSDDGTANNQVADDQA